MTTTVEYGTNKEQQSEWRWLPLVNRATLLRSTVVAVVIGSILTLINQHGWVVGDEQLQLLPFILVFLTPFTVVTIAQVAGVRQAHIDSVAYRAPASPESFMTTVVSHGIPARAIAIGLFFGTLNAIVTLGGALLHSGDISAMSVAPIGQAYVLPLLFGFLSQAITYRRSRSYLQVR